jgi:hypothetical protein
MEMTVKIRGCKWKLFYPMNMETRGSPVYVSVTWLVINAVYQISWMENIQNNFVFLNQVKMKEKNIYFV